MENLRLVEAEIETLTVAAAASAKPPSRSHRSTGDLHPLQPQSMDYPDSSGGRPPAPPPRGEASTQRQQQPHVRSANLEQLYHEALPSMVDKALSHSGPAAGGMDLECLPSEMQALVLCALFCPKGK